MHRPRLRLAAAVALVLGTALTGSCASESHGIDVSGGWEAYAAPEEGVVDEVPAPEEPPSLLVFGDSWTYGLAASDLHLGYAYVTGEILGWDTEVDGENGSGYLRPGQHGGFYGSRVAALDRDLDPDVVVVQGSINDRGQNLDGLERAARSVWHAFEATYPEAQLVILGPAPATLPLDDGVKAVDRRLGELAEAEGVVYISPIADEWITEDNIDSVIDSSESGSHHPSDEGHAYLAELLAAELGAIAPNSVLSARG